MTTLNTAGPIAGLTLLDGGPLEESADGTAHLTVYVDHHAFCWTGQHGHPIEVSAGGSGEPVVAHLWLTPPPDVTLEAALGLLRAAADQYLAFDPDELDELVS